MCLPDANEDFSGRRCYVSGWGKDAFVQGSYQHVMKAVDLPVLSNQVCQRMLRRTRLGPQFELYEGFLCAGGEEGKDACKVRKRLSYLALHVLSDIDTKGKCYCN